MPWEVSETDVRRWAKELEQIGETVAVRFGRPEVRRRAPQYLRGLIAQVERKNGWQLAEFLGEETPKNLQHFIARSQWSANEVRDDLTRYVVEHLGEADGVLILDETGFLKKGTKSAGVARMYSGTAGRIENCQIGVFLAYATSRGQALIDRELYLPQVWTEDRPRCRAAHIPDDVEFATKPQLARYMIQRAMAIGVPARWVTADEVYGSDYQFRRCCEQQGLGYVVAISSGTHLFLNGRRTKVSEHLPDVPAEAWQRLSCGTGAKGERLYDWAFVSWPSPEEDGFERGWLVRRSIDEPAELAHYFTHALQGTSLQQLVQIAGRRWAIEECFEQAKQLTGLDEYEVRSWVGWHRHITLSMLAHALLAVIRARAQRQSRTKKALPN
ncbi:MAG TPA: IS701 family transposase [Planctomicrobium sp.]|nr:IS701 family transposase [Planctomicrobium sp.]